MITAVATVKFNKLGQVAKKLESETERILDKGADAGLAASTPVTPIDSGDLRKNTRIDEGDMERTILWLQDYAAYQDQGTVHNRGHNFTGTAAKRGTEVIVKEFSSMDLG